MKKKEITPNLREHCPKFQQNMNFYSQVINPRKNGVTSGYAVRQNYSSICVLHYNTNLHLTHCFLWVTTRTILQVFS